MKEAALLLAVLFHRNPNVVLTIYDVTGLDGVTTVWMESQFVETAFRREPRGHNSWGLWQLDNEFHPQYREDLLMHIVTGANFFLECKQKAGGNLKYTMVYFNGALSWGERVERERNSLALYLWRHMR